MKPSGFVKPMVGTSTAGLTWPYAPMVLPDGQGVERLVVRYDSGTGLGKTPKERGLAVFNEEKSVFEPRVKWDVNAPVIPDGIAFPVTEAGVRYFYFADGNPTPRTRVRANWADVLDLSKYERLAATDLEIVDIVSGRKLNLRSISVQWHGYRKCWIMLAQQVDGIASKLGEIWVPRSPIPTRTLEPRTPDHHA